MCNSYIQEFKLICVHKMFQLTGEKLIKDILDDFLFPASKLIFDTRSTPTKETVIDVHPK